MTTAADWQIIRGAATPRELHGAYYRIRLLYGRWYVCLYSDITARDLIGDYGPFNSVLEAHAAVDEQQMISIDATQEPLCQYPTKAISGSSAKLTVAS